MSVHVLVIKMTTGKKGTLAFGLEYSLNIILMGMKELVVFLVSDDCCVAHPLSAMGLSAVCDCGISLSYSHIIFGYYNFIK